MMNNILHQPVLMTEVMQGLSLNAHGIYVDATFGRGGHTSAILQHLGPQGRVFAFDKDPEAVAHARHQFAHDPRFLIFHSSFIQMQRLLTEAKVAGLVNGILFDLGVSSPQLDEPDRGFSFMRAGKLDMRMDTSQGIDAMTWLAKVSEVDLATVLWEYGEERASRRLAKAIIAARAKAPITTTTQLADIIASVLPRSPRGKHPATRAFLAIRIAINQELKEVQSGLTQALQVLAPKGRLAVISFHSLEDRIVKNFIRHEEKGADIPSDLPIKYQEFSSRLKRVGTAIKPSEGEIANNPRARSAVLRIAEKIS